MQTQKEKFVGLKSCDCSEHNSPLKLIVLTGGPGGGKTAILELAQRVFCKHLAFIPEAATIAYSGGFWRMTSMTGVKAVQRTICYIQKELEGIIEVDSNYSAGICDRGIIDSIAYWPDSETNFWESIGRTREEVYRHYSTIIHLKTPTSEKLGYNLNNPVRNESIDEANQLDEKTLAVWDGHPNRHIIEPTEDFMHKAEAVFDLIKKELPKCCPAG